MHLNGSRQPFPVLADKELFRAQGFSHDGQTQFPSRIEFTMSSAELGFSLTDVRFRVRAMPITIQEGCAFPAGGL